MKRLYVRPELCTGCKTCELACAVEHSRSKNLLGAMIESPPPHPRLYVEAVAAAPFVVLKLPMTCRHCDPAPCMASCIPQAMWRTPEGVVVNLGGPRACIACGMCIMTCPFGMIGRGAAADDQGVGASRVMALKCDLCPGRDVPACAASCPTGALTFEEGDDFAHANRQRATAVLASARELRETVLDGERYHGTLNQP